jgi:hypothetical protein
VARTGPASCRVETESSWKENGLVNKASKMKRNEAKLEGFEEIAELSQDHLGI